MDSVAACSLPPLWVAEMHVRHQLYIVTTISVCEYVCDFCETNSKQANSIQELKDKRRNS